MLGPTAPPAGSEASSGTSAKALVGLGALGLAGVGIAIGVTYGVLGVVQSDGSTATESQRDASARNDRIARDRTVAVVGLAAGGALAATGLVVLLWPSAPRGVQAQVSATGASLGLSGAF